MLTIEEAERMIAQLRGENKTLREELSEVKHENFKLRKRVEELEKLLGIYKNPHIPPSKQIIKEVKVPKPQKKRGAPEGHKGTTREIPTPDIIADLKPKECGKCGSGEITILKEYRKIVEDIQIVKVVTEFHYYLCRCENCNNEFTTTDAELPVKGNFGPNITSLWENLHYIGNIPFGRLAEISGNCFGVEISPGGLHNVVYRTAEIFQPNFEEIKERITDAEYVRSDETSYPFNGKKYWLWNISTKKDTLVLLRNTRSSKVLRELFGEFFDGILNSDCHTAYGRFEAKEYQKCWAHVLRDAEDLAKNSEEGKQLHKMLLHMYEYIKKVKKKKQENTPKVKAWINRAKKKISEWTNKNWNSKAITNLILRMEKYRDHWFTCLKHRKVEPTNNGSERDIRKNVIARKISGQHRSEKGMNSREIMMSTILTLQKRDRNPFEFIQNGIREYNSGLGPPKIS